jgi:hypothetical protein
VNEGWDIFFETENRITCLWEVVYVQDLFTKTSALKNIYLFEMIAHRGVNVEKSID